MTVFEKDPNAILDYVFDWTDWLATGETITAITITAPTGITATEGINAAGKITTWLSGGESGTRYTIACKIVTSVGSGSLYRTDERSFVIHCLNR